MNEAVPAPVSDSASLSTPAAAPCAAAPTGFAQLSAPQQTALGALSQGSTMKAAAKAAGVDRVTVGRWLRADPRFRAAYNAWRQELIDSTRSRLLRTAELAAAAVHKQIANGDGRLALALLDRLGLASQATATAGTPDAETARDELVVERQEQLHALQRRVKATRDFRFWSEDREHLEALRRQADEQASPADEASK